MNNRQILAGLAGILSLATGIFAVQFLWFSEAPEPVPLGPGTHYIPSLEGSFSGPFGYKNLTVYLVHGRDTLKGKTPLTLEEAMAKKVVVVHETEDVNELAIENVSPASEVYVQAGDIVKGGKQDRVLAVDLIVPARSGRIPIDSFCVEQGRWTARGSESSTRFESSADYAPSKEMKLAAKHAKSQSQVWAKVAESQEKLSTATNANTSSNVSRSSLPLTLEHSRVRSDSAEYVKALASIADGKPDVVGFVFAINGEINSAETYGSAALFQKLWPKLLKAASIEAVAESAGNESAGEVALEDIESFFDTSESAPLAEDRRVTDRISLITRETKTTVLSESQDRRRLLHRSYIMK